MRRIFFATFSLCAAMSAPAAILNKSQSQVVVPDTAAGFEFGLTGAYLRADYPQVDYVLQDNNAANGIPDGRFIDNEADHDLGYGLMLGYRFGCQSGIDTRLHYFTFSSDDDSGVTGSNLYRTTGIADGHDFWTGTVNDDDDDDDDDTSINYLNSARSHNEFDLKAIDLELGQNINVGCHTSLRFFVGLSHHDIERDTMVTYAGERTNFFEDDDDDDETPEGPEGDSMSTDQLRESVVKHSEFKGWGPRVGMDMAYAFNNGFGIVGHLSTAFFFGDVDVKTAVSRSEQINEVEQGPQGPMPLSIIGGPECNVGVNISSRRIVVPNVDLRLGIDYSHCFCSGTVLTAELGYCGRGYLGGVGDVHLDHSKHITQFDNVVYHGAYLTLRAQL